MECKSILAEDWESPKPRKKAWWVPFPVILMGLGMLLVFAQNAAGAPFIYGLF